MEEDGGRSAERLVTFTDAVVAIAVTLLALPLADIARGWDGDSLGALVQDAAPPLLGFAISFFVIARLWWSHHRIFEHVLRWDPTLVRVTIVWLFTVVLLAPATALTGRSAHDTAPVALYIGVMLLSSVCLTVLAWHIRRHAELTDGRDDDAWRRLFGSVETTAGFVVALVIGTVFPQINYFSLLVLVLTGRIGRVIERRHERRLNIR
ncbi:MAG: DUF1211 domain-containing protein [Acidobacteria bacterium]|nr:DUF1211 domain-containing protein [Acidobacteriota bacterium]